MEHWHLGFPARKQRAGVRAGRIVAADRLAGGRVRATNIFRRITRRSLCAAERVINTERRKCINAYFYGEEVRFPCAKRVVRHQERVRHACMHTPRVLGTKGGGKRRRKAAGGANGRKRAPPVDARGGLERGDESRSFANREGRMRRGCVEGMKSPAKSKGKRRELERAPGGHRQASSPTNSE